MKYFESGTDAEKKFKPALRKSVLATDVLAQLVVFADFSARLVQARSV